MSELLARLRALQGAADVVGAPAAPDPPPARLSRKKREERRAIAREVVELAGAHDPEPERSIRPAPVAATATEAAAAVHEAPLEPAPTGQRLLDRIRSLDGGARAELVGSLAFDEAVAMMFDWRGIWARAEQLAPGTPGALPPTDRNGRPIVAWLVWFVLAGRGFGKTRTGAEWAIEQARAMPGSHGALVGPTAADVRDTMLSSGLESVEGASGILAVSPPDFRPVYSPSKRSLVWPNGTRATLYSAEEPERLRGPQHAWAWADELAAWQYAEAWDMLMFGLRLGADPKACVTTTPKPKELILEILSAATTAVTRGKTSDNAINLSPTFFSTVVAKYKGTTLGRQELEGEVLEEVEGALWKREWIDRNRATRPSEFKRVVLAIDPAVSTNAKSAETGIVVAGVAPCACKVRKGGQVELHAFVLADLSGKHDAPKWARIAVDTAAAEKADRIVGEDNNGGNLVEANVRTADPLASYKAVHASDGKRTRAEPISSLYQQGRVHHVGTHRALEDQQCSWDPLGGERSPDRLDACVWALSELMLNPSVTSYTDTDDVEVSTRRM